MNTKRFLLTLYIISMILGSQLVEAKLYRWKDASGNIYYSDKVPPNDNKYRRDSLNDNARVVETTEAEKSEQQKLLDKRLSKLRSEQKKVLNEQMDQDKVLLSTFRTEADMRRALTNKLQSIEAKKRVSEGNLQRLEYQLQTQQKEAASYERKGKSVPDKLLAEIKATEQQMILVENDISRLKLKIRKTEEVFNKDVKRFLFLSQKQKHHDPVKTGTDTTLSNLGLYTCKNQSQCTAAWDIARLFVQNNSTTAIELDTKKLILTAEPQTDNDISLSVSRIKSTSGVLQIFLDVKCYASKVGAELCSSPKIREMRADFSPFIEAILPSQQ